MQIKINLKQDANIEILWGFGMDQCGMGCVYVEGGLVGGGDGERVGGRNFSNL